MDFINRVEISGEISEIRTSEKGTCFVMLKQMVTYNGIERPRLFEILVSSDKHDIISKLQKGKNAKVNGTLTVFRMKKFDIHKMLVEANSIEILD